MQIESVQLHPPNPTLQVPGDATPGASYATPSFDPARTAHGTPGQPPRFLGPTSNLHTTIVLSCPQRVFTLEYSLFFTKTPEIRYHIPFGGTRWRLLDRQGLGWIWMIITGHRSLVSDTMGIEHGLVVVSVRPQRLNGFSPCE